MVVSVVWLRCPLKVGPLSGIIPRTLFGSRWASTDANRESGCLVALHAFTVVRTLPTSAVLCVVSGVRRPPCLRLTWSARRRLVVQCALSVGVVPASHPTVPPDAYEPPFGSSRSFMIFIPTHLVAIERGAFIGRRKSMTRKSKLY